MFKGSASPNDPPVPYEWERLWYPADGTRPVDPDGFTSATAEAGPDGGPVHSLGALDDVPCLLLTGEAGLGKSVELEADGVRLRERGCSVLPFKLPGVASDYSLHNYLLGPARTELERTGRAVFLLLDSLDEGLIRMSNLREALLTGFQALRDAGVEPSALRLRITARPSAVPAEFVAGLRECFGGNGVRHYSLAPLRRADVAAAIESHGRDPAAFLAAVEQRRIGHLAARPLTFRMLRDEFLASHNLADRPSVLFEGAVLHAATEFAPARTDRVSIPPQTRVETAQRLAAVQIFSGKRGISTAAFPATPDLVAVQAAVADWIRERSSAGQECADTLDGGLFDASDAGGQRREFVHSTYAEFLAARALAQAHVVDLRLTQLLTVPSHTGRRVAPQLMEVAAWLYALQPAARKRLRDPLLQDATGWLVSVAEIPEDDRAAVTDRLLRAIRLEAIPEGADLARHFHRLSHPALEDQLRPYLAPGTRARRRETAIQIAAACGVRGVADVLAQTALDPATPVPTRAAALDALALVGTPEDRERIRPLAVDPGNIHPELRGRALRVTWGTHVRINDILPILHLRVDDAPGSAFAAFVGSDLPRALPPADRTALLRHLSSTQALRHTAAGRAAEGLVTGILRDPAVDDGSLAAALRFLRDARDLFRSAGAGLVPRAVAGTVPTGAHRRRILHHLAQLGREAPVWVTRVTSEWPALASVEDREWLAEQAARAAAEDREIWNALTPREIGAEAVYPGGQALDTLLAAFGAPRSASPGVVPWNPDAVPALAPPALLRLAQAARQRLERLVAWSATDPADRLALRVLVSEPEVWSSIPVAQLARWAEDALLVAVEGSAESAAAIILAFHERVPDTLEHAVGEIFLRAGSDEVLLVLQKFPEALWDEYLAVQVHSTIGDADDDVSEYARVTAVTRYKLGRGGDHAFDFGSPAVTFSCLCDGTRRQRAAAVAHVAHLSVEAAVRVVDVQEHVPSTRPRFDGVPPQELQELALCLLDVATHEGNDDSQRVDAARWADAALSELAAAGEADLVHRVAAAFPFARGARTRHLLRVARRAALQHAWVPLDPADVAKLLARDGARIVSSAQDLQDVVLEILEQMEEDLTGIVPVAPLLWHVPDPKASDEPRPKHEEALSDFVHFYLRLRLDRGGVILNREVQTWQGRTKGWPTGERLDILVQAVTPDGRIVAVVVEVKRSANEEWPSAMQSQLVERYLRTREVRHGIYLVGYYPGSVAHSSDYPTRAAVSSHLEEQARSLSKHDVAVRAAVVSLLPGDAAKH